MMFGLAMLVVLFCSRLAKLWSEPGQPEETEQEHRTRVLKMVKEYHIICTPARLGVKEEAVMQPHEERVVVEKQEPFMAIKAGGNIGGSRDN
jgi:hypothetical protein